MKRIIILLFVFFSINQIVAYEKGKNTGEYLALRNSPVFSIQDDVSLEKKYSNVTELITNEDYLRALEAALDLLEESKKQNSFIWIYRTKSLLGKIYRKTNKLNKSLQLYKQALSQISSTSIEEDIYLTDINLVEAISKVGAAHQFIARSIDLSVKNSFTSVLDSINQLKIKIKHIDSAKLFYKKIEIFPSLNKEIESLKARAFNNLSGIYEVDSKYVKAKEYAEKAIAIHKRNHDALSTAISLNNLANISLSQGEYQKAKKIYLEALDLIKFDNNFKAIKAKADLNFNLAWSMRKLEEFEAYDYQEISYNIQDEIRKKEYRIMIDEFILKYDFESKKKLLLKEGENKRLRDLQAFLVIGIIGLVIIISLAYRNKLNKLKQKNQALNFSQQELLKNQEIEKIKSDSQTRILNATIDGEESERKQIAETLHDSVSALLSAANMHLQATRKQFNGDSPAEIDKTQKLIEEASHKVRDLSHNLVSSVLLKFGLNFAIKDIAEKYSNSILTIDANVDELRRYDQNFEIKVYNIIQEFVNNILRHSKANNALIALKEKDKKLFLTISDDGVGFDKTKINMKDGLGINQIDARIQIMNGQFFIKSSFNNGTIIYVELPILDKDALTNA